MKHLIIIGVGGFAREVYWHAQDSLGYGTKWDLKGFLDGDVRLEAEEYKKLELPVLGNVNGYEIQGDDVFICAIGKASIRRKLVEIMLAKGAEFITIVHKTAIIHGNASIGKGVIISSLVRVHDHVKIGDFTIVNVLAGFGHDSSVGRYVDIMSAVGLDGCVRVEDEAFLADGAVILPYGVVEKGAYVGARSVVFKRVKAGTKVFGTPAMPI